MQRLGFNCCAGSHWTPFTQSSVALFQTTIPTLCQRPKEQKFKHTHTYIYFSLPQFFIVSFQCHFNIGMNFGPSRNLFHNFPFNCTNGSIEWNHRAQQQSAVTRKAVPNCSTEERNVKAHQLANNPLIWIYCLDLQKEDSSYEWNAIWISRFFL